MNSLKSNQSRSQSHTKGGKVDQGTSIETGQDTVAVIVTAQESDFNLSKTK